MGSPTTRSTCSDPALRLLHTALDTRGRGDRRRALDALDRAVALDGRCLDARRARGLLLMEMGRPDRALADLDAAARLDPDCARCALEQGTARLLAGRPAEAVEAFDRALALEPELAAAHASRAAALLQLGRPDEALKAISTARALRPDNDADLHNRALVRTVLGQYEVAIRDYERALALNPASGGTHNNLAWLLATAADPALRNGPRALRHARRAVQQDRNAGWLDTLAAAHAECGDFRSAVEAEAEACRRAGPRNEAFRRRLRAYRNGLTYAAWRQQSGRLDRRRDDAAQLRRFVHADRRELRGQR
jgi:tetratricopeptide (TPR) repeat protein